MKKNIIYTLFIGLLALIGCRDESLNPVPDWDPAVHGFGVFDNGGTTKPALTTNYTMRFPADNQDAASATIPLKVRWVSLDNKLAVSKVEVYIEMVEYFQDVDLNDKQASLGKKLIKTFTSPAGNRQWNAFAISASEVYNLYKDATVKYDKINAIKVFENPANPRPKAKWFNGSEDFIVTWVLTTSDGKVFGKFNEDSICGDPTDLSEASANCQIIFAGTPCSDYSLFESGSWSVSLDEKNDFKVGANVRVKVDPITNEFTVEATSNDGSSHKDLALTVTNALTGAVKIKKQSYGTYGADTTEWFAEGIGIIDGCLGTIDLVLTHTSTKDTLNNQKFKLVRK